jgi:hypothetical protein
MAGRSASPLTVGPSSEAAGRLRAVLAGRVLPGYAPGVDATFRLFLRLGDRVFHAYHEEWGQGAVVEEMTSTIVGGTCLVRILFDDGIQRTFNNDLDHEMCCYFMGVRRDVAWDWDRMERTQKMGPAGRSSARPPRTAVRRRLGRD